MVVVMAVFLHDSIRSNQANFRVQALVGMGRVFLRHPHGARGTMRDSMKEPRDKTPSAAKRARSARGADGRGRWPSRRRTEVGPRLFRGETLDAPSRELGVTPCRLAQS
jgi:hypothetical protein